MSWISLDLKTFSFKHAGIGRYTQELSRRLLEQKRFRYFGVLGPETDPQAVTELALSQHACLNRKSTVLRSLSLSFFLPKYIELHHAMDNSCLLSIGKKIKKVVTIHDVLVFLQPECFTLKHRLVVQNLIRAAVRWADHIITVSESSKGDLLRVFPKLREESVSVTHLAASFDPLGSGLDDTALRKHFPSLPKKYLLALGTLEPRKNLGRLIGAYTELKSRGRIDEDVGLVIAGSEGWLRNSWGYDPQKLSRTGVHALGFIDDVWLPALYRSALAFVYPSLYEGFGLPPLEAMSQGTPVILSQSSSLPEVGGQAALYVDPYSVESIAATIEAVVTDSSLRETLGARTRIQSQKFSWLKTAKRTEDVYHSVLSR